MTKVIFMKKVYEVKPDVSGELGCDKCAFQLARDTEASWEHGCIHETRMTTLDGDQYPFNCGDSDTYYVEAA